MNAVGAFEAKAHLFALLERVAKGEEIIITRHGKAVARLVPAATAHRAQIDRAIARLKALREGTSLGGLSWHVARRPLLENPARRRTKVPRLARHRALARTERLTTCDAAYLELAMRRGLPLATQDRVLREAGKRLGVSVLPA